MKSCTQITNTADSSLSTYIAAKWDFNSTKMFKSLATLLFVSLILSTLFSIFISPSPVVLWLKLPQKDLHVEDLNSPQPQPQRDKLLGGLLLQGLDEKLCESRYQSYLYGRSKHHKPSLYLTSKLRNYEALQKKCGPNTENYNKTVKNLRYGKNVRDNSTCKYVIFMPYDGLGNRILTIGASFLFALLTNRVLLINDGGDIADLFCEPFPEVSWLLPSDFNVRQFENYSHYRYRDLVQNGSFRNSNVPLFVYHNLGFGYKDNDKIFFCEHDQILLQHVPWLMIRSNLYYIPSLFTIPSFQQELDNLFPEKETVFHHLGRYLFHPSNSVWGLITLYYDTYLAKADEILGIQIRFYPPNFFRRTPSVNQVLSCAINNNLLPDFNVTQRIIKPSKYQPFTKAILFASLSVIHSEEIRKIYWQYSAITGEAIAVYQPSHDEYQQSQDLLHNRKALAEMYLLSMSDKLVTTAMSTFGYTAQSLGGLRPWILNEPLGRVMPNPPCQQSPSMDPCFHYAPAFNICQSRAYHVPHVQQCVEFNEKDYLGMRVVN